MASLKERLAARVEELRQRRPVVDHAVRMWQHYGNVTGNLQAGAVTYFAFLSFFPILALAFFTVGWVAKVYPQAQSDLVQVIEDVLPGIIGGGDSQLSIEDIESAAGTVGLIGLVGVLYSGLGWLSAMREALAVMFATPARQQPGFVVGKLRDLASLVAIGLVLLVSVGISGVISTYSLEFLELVGLDAELSPVLKVFTVLVGIGANMLLFYALFRLLAEPDLPTRSLWSGAMLGALGFEVLKRLSALLLAATKASPAVQAFGIALVLVVWINYFSRVVMYAAAWAQTAPDARAHRERIDRVVEDASVAAGYLADRQPAPARPVTTEESAPRSNRAAFAAGGVSMLALVAAARRLVTRKDRS